ncbi:two-component system histidine kinase PnpS [Halanaerobium congolense]|uniref:histidine kinase n=1 Tax=Halanaerobium congolense TaxID=54121 RepID=A0A1G6LL05_9FIRM|nr:ATP-binding protein [Halanaerobium congolense]PXV68712.1 PAS/PAC sensor signal transduction histidine kinase [Halanaerobium congolense]TDP07987.1 PAS/PAC sensor signal transduction histidine kinase [Halanaerobium congolense]TDS29146.1 PAS/PAC sensor signal transduction histidine kinase [Halanaerobium congolense]SDC43988.1 PAS/PAC sensor signal transduction histidine kinase [Halanaerobium congolense]SDH44753.1 PAS/PAC sensor signal transduction histidine kinase [Halanaerobium congolense]
MLKWNKIGIKNRLSVIFIVIQLLIIGLSFYYFSINHREFYLEQEKISLEHYSQLMLNNIEESEIKNFSPNLEEKAADWSDDSETRITIIAADGRVLADSHYEISEMDNHRNRPEVVQAVRSNDFGNEIRYSETIGEKMLYYAVPINSDGEIIGILRTARPLSFIRGVLVEDIKSYLFFFVILAFITIILGWRLTYSIVKPLETVTETAEKISEGDLTQRIPVRKYNSEIEKLARMFNYMADELEDKVTEISQEKNRIEAILESMVDGVIAVDKDGEITLINPAASRIFNIEAEKIEGKDLLTTLFSHRIEMYLQRAFDTKKSIKREIKYKNPEQKIIQATFIPLLDEEDKITGGVIVLTDITELRKLETVRNDFVANVSHELRTPLTSIVGYLDTLLESDVEDPEIRNKFLKIIKEEADRLSILIKDLLNLSEIESHTFDLKPGSFKNVLNKVIKLMEKNAEKKEIELQFEIADDLSPVYMVREQIKQVLINLFDNAIKYTPRAGKIKITVRQIDDKVYFSIKDNGMGIPQADQERIFERFYRVDKARSRAFGGTGIGLSIVRNIIKQHGSEIQVKSREGEGSEFYFYLNTVESK